MIKKILEKAEWYEQIRFQNQKVQFNHKKDYNQWIKKVQSDKNRKIVFDLIKQGKIQSIINKAINNEKVVNSKEENLCIYALKSRLKILFNKRDLILITVLQIEADIKDCSVILTNEFFNENRFEHEYLDYLFEKQGVKGNLFIEHFVNESIISFTCDKLICLEI